MTVLGDWPDGVTKAWHVHNMMRRLGFSADDIFVGTKISSETGHAVVRVELRTQGKCFGAHVAKWEDDADDFNGLWASFAARVTGSDRFSDEELEAVSAAHAPQLPIEDLAIAILGKGISVPALVKAASAWKKDARTLEQVLEKHAEKLAYAAKRFVESRLDPKAHVCLVLEVAHERFSAIRRAFGVKRDPSHDAIVAILDRKTGVPGMRAIGVGVSDRYLESVDAAGALPIVVCAAEGVDVSSILVEIERVPS